MGKPSRRRWTGRTAALLAALALATASLAGAAARDAVSHIRGTRVPAWIENVAPADAAVVTRQFDQAIASGGLRRLPTNACWPCRARDALRQEPLAAGPLRILALYANERKDLARATPMFTTAARLSRRDPVVQLWMIERAGRAGDIAGMVRHYDQMLSFRPETGPLLFPRLRDSLGDPRVRAQLVPLVRARKPWIENFLNSAVSEVSQPRGLVALFKEVDNGKPPARDVRPYELRAIELLARAGDYRLAYEHARRIAGKDAKHLAAPGFAPATSDGDYAPFAWVPGENEGIVAQSFESGSMRVELAPGSSGLAVTRVLLLAPGSHAVRFAARPVEGFAVPEGRWEASCERTGGATARLMSVPLSRGPAGLTASGRFVVPPSCPATRLSFFASATAGQEDAALELTGLALDPSSPAAPSASSAAAPAEADSEG